MAARRRFIAFFGWRRQRRLNAEYGRRLIMSIRSRQYQNNARVLCRLLYHRNGVIPSTR